MKRIRAILLVALAACTFACNASELAHNAEDEAKAARTQAARARAEAAAAKKEALEAQEAAAEAKAEAKKALAKAEEALKKVNEKPACVQTAHVPKLGAPKISFTSKGIEINGKKMPEKPTLTDLRAALGTADRVAKLANDIHVYEKLGVIAYQTPGTERISQVTIFFSRMTYAFTPTETFQGVLTIEGSTVDVANKTTTQDLTPTLHVDVVLRDDQCLGTVGIGFNAK